MTTKEVLDILIHEFPISETEVVRVYISPFRDKQYLHIRTHYQSENGMLPGKGFSLVDVDDNWESLCEALKKLVVYLEESSHD